MESSGYKYERILLKLSGEFLGGEKKSGFDVSRIAQIADQICIANRAGVQIAVVVGGGNLFRGADNHPMLERSAADYIGMLGTVMNGSYLQQAVEYKGGKSRLMSSIPMTSIAEPFIRRRAVRHLEKGRVVILAAGTGNPFFSTDTAAVLRGSELNVDIVVKGTQVDGIYDKDPHRHQNAFRFEEISYDDIMKNDLKVMDLTSISFSKNYHIPVYVMDIGSDGAFLEFLQGKNVGTRVIPSPD